MPNLSKWGFTKTVHNVECLDEIMEELKGKFKIQEVYEFDPRLKRHFLEVYMVLLTDNIDWDKIKRLEQKLTKKSFLDYKNVVIQGFNSAKKVITEEEFKKKEEIYEEYLKQEEERRKQEEIIELKKAIELKERIIKEGKEYRDKNWIEKNIGKYYSWDTSYEYFWSIIGNEYFQKWNGEIVLTKNKLNEIKNIGKNECGLKGTTFLGRKFKYNGYSHEINTKEFYGEEKEKPKSYGVYGIYKNDTLLYIGSTMREFSVRFEEHSNNIINHSNELYVYSLIEDDDNITFKKLIDAATLKTNSELTKRDIQSMELALINTMNPPGNLAGRSYEYKY